MIIDEEVMQARSLAEWIKDILVEARAEVFFPEQKLLNTIIQEATNFVWYLHIVQNERTRKLL